MAKKKTGKRPMRRFAHVVNAEFDADAAVVGVALDQSAPHPKVPDEDGDYVVPGRADGDPPELDFE